MCSEYVQNMFKIPIKSLLLGDRKSLMEFKLLNGEKKMKSLLLHFKKLTKRFNYLQYREIGQLKKGG